MDFESYISNYEGYTRIQRLFYAADKFPEYKKECMEICVKLLKDGDNYRDLMKAYEALNDKTKTPQVLDQVIKKCNLREERLEQELKHYKNNMIKESIRMGYNDLGDHHMATGNLSEAFKCVIKSKEYCTTAKHLVELGLRAIQLCLDMGNLGNVANYAFIAKNASGVDAAALAKIELATALVELSNRNYRKAFDLLISVQLDGYSNNLNSIATANDIVVYVVFCALASLKRQEIKKRVLENPTFKPLLLLDTGLKKALTSYLDSKYAETYNYLKTRADSTLKYDIYLGSQVFSLLEQIQKSIVVNYVNSFSTADIRKISSVLCIELNQLETLLLKLINENVIKFKIDGRNKILYSTCCDQKTQLYAYLQEMMKKCKRIDQSLYYRANSYNLGFQG